MARIKYFDPESGEWKYADKVTPKSRNGTGGTGADGFSPIANVTQTEDGAVISITDKTGTTTATITNGKDGKDGSDGKSAYAYAQEAGFTGTEVEFAEKLADDTPAVDSGAVNELIDTKLHSVASYGARGDGSTDDTQAFQNALAANRVITVPGGTYKLSGTLVIRENCCLELSQDTVLKFTQTSGYAIEMRSSATLRGNHAIISVPYAFTGSVIAMDTVNDGEDHNSIPPYTKAGSNMFKRQRFIYDVNIIKPDSVGFCRSMDGNCNGTAIYMSAEGTASFRWMWGITMSGIRIAGGFSYGIRAANFDKPGDYEDNAWNHDMRIEAVIEACEIGVSLENCNGAHLAVTIQPYKAQNNGAIYAKHGVYLNDARFIDMIGSRVWDWNASNTLWTSGGQYQHLALVGNCRGLILDDFLCHESSMSIRDLIYTDTPGNFDTMTILQEPGNKWFKSVDGEPYFNNGNSNIRLAAKTDIDEYFVTDRIATFTDVLKTSIDKDGNIYGTASGYYDSKFDNLSSSAYHIHTGFIACKKGDTFYTDGVKIRDEGNVRVTFFDSEFNYITNVSGKNMIAGNYYVDPIVSTEKGFQLTVKNINDANINKIAYARFNFYASDVGDNPVMTVNEEIKYTQAGFLADTIKVKGENVIGGTGGGSSAPSDWNAAEGEPGHVLNRTHYTYTATFIPEAELQLGDDGEFVVETAEVFEAGKTYTIYWNGTAYNCTAVSITAEDGTAEGGTVVVFGNMAAVGGDDTGEPFCVAYMPGMLVIMPMDETVTTVTLRVDGVKTEKIPVEYIPNQNVIISIDEFLDESYGVHKISLDTTDLWYAFKNGYPVCVKVGGKDMHYAVQIQTITVIDESLLDYYGVANIPFTLHVYDIFLNKRHMILINTSD